LIAAHILVVPRVHLLLHIIHIIPCAEVVPQIRPHIIPVILVVVVGIAEEVLIVEIVLLAVLVSSHWLLELIIVVEVHLWLLLLVLEEIGILISGHIASHHLLLIIELWLLAVELVLHPSHIHRLEIGLVLVGLLLLHLLHWLGLHRLEVIWVRLLAHVPHSEYIIKCLRNKFLLFLLGFSGIWLLLGGGLLVEIEWV